MFEEMIRIFEKALANEFARRELADQEMRVPFPVLNSLTPGALDRAQEILMSGRGVGMDFGGMRQGKSTFAAATTIALPGIYTPDITFDTIDFYDNRGHRARTDGRHFSIMDDLWNVRIYEPMPGWGAKRVKDWESPLPHQRRGPECHHTRITASGLPPRHPTKGFRRSHKNFTRGRR